MTKEEILWLKPHPTPDSVSMNGAKEAMDEYAKQQAIAFADFVKAAPDIWAEPIGTLKYRYHKYTTEQLYELFLKSK